MGEVAAGTAGKAQFSVSQTWQCSEESVVNALGYRRQDIQLQNDAFVMVTLQKKVKQQTKVLAAGTCM